jgi:hypothetical protein
MRHGQLRPFSLWAVLVPAIAAGHSLSDEFGVGSSQSGPRNPRTGFLYDRVSGVASASEKLDLRFDLTLTHDVATKPKHGARFGDTGGNIAAGAFGIDWNPNDHFTLGAELDFSPRSSQSSDTTVTFDDGAATSKADALLKTTTSSVGFGLSGGYDTAGSSNFETLLNASASVTHFSAVEDLSSIEGANGAVDRQNVLSYCTRVPTAAGCRQLLALFRLRGAEVNQFKLSALLLETVMVDTDLSLSGGYYFYDHDPSQLGFFNIVSFGRTSFGNGMPLAPLRFTLRPGVGHRFGPLLLDLSYQYSQYVPGDGHGNGVALKVQYKFSKSFKAWITANGQDDRDDQGNSTISSGLAFGLRYSF